MQTDSHTFKPSPPLKEVTLVEVCLWLLRRRRHFRVTKNSMQPSIKRGDILLVNPAAYRCHPPAPGDIVIAQHPYRTDVTMVKQVTAVDESGRCYLQSENPFEGTDSKSFGKVPSRLILGQVTCQF